MFVSGSVTFASKGHVSEAKLRVPSLQDITLRKRFTQVVGLKWFVLTSVDVCMYACMYVCMYATQKLRKRSG